MWTKHSIEKGCSWRTLMMSQSILSLEWLRGERDPLHWAIAGCFPLLEWLIPGMAQRGGGPLHTVGRISVNIVFLPCPRLQPWLRVASPTVLKLRCCDAAAKDYMAVLQQSHCTMEMGSKTLWVLLAHWRVWIPLWTSPCHRTAAICDCNPLSEVLTLPLMQNVACNKIIVLIT